MATHFNDVLNFLTVQTSISISVIDFKRPFEFVLKFPTEDEVYCCHKLQEVNYTILREHGIFSYTSHVLTRHLN